MGGGEGMGEKERKETAAWEKEEGRKAFPIEVAFYANVLPFLPSSSPQKSGEKGGVSTKERIYVKRALRARHQKKREWKKIR